MEPGWYFDPDDDSAIQKYWDGGAWTNETRKGPPDKFLMRIIRPLVAVALGVVAFLAWLVIWDAFLLDVNQDIPGILSAVVFVGVAAASLVWWSRSASRKQKVAALEDQLEAGNIDRAGYDIVREKILG